MNIGCCCSVTESCLTLCNCLDSSTRVPCPSLFLGVCWNPCPLRQWCHPTILSPFAPFSTCLPSFPASGAFPLSCLFTSGGQSTGASASSSVLPRKIQGWFPLGLTGWSPGGPRDSQLSSPEPQFKSISSSALSLIYGPTFTLVHDYWENHRFDYMDFVSKWCLCFLIFCIGLL